MIVLLGEGRGELGGSEYLKVVHNVVAGEPPALDLERERALQDLLVGLADARLIRSAHDCADGGFAVALAECCFGTLGTGGTGGIGAEVSIDGVNAARDARMNDAAALFGESASRVLISAAADQVAEVLTRAAAARVPARVIGQTGGNLLRIAVGGRVVIDLPVDDAERAWSTAIEKYFEKRVA